MESKLKPGKRELIVSEKKLESNRANLKKAMNPEAQTKAKITKSLTMPTNRLIKETSLDYIRQSLLKPMDENGTPYYQVFITNFLQDALEDPEGKCSQMLSSGLFNERLLEVLDSEKVETKKIDIEYERYKLMKTLYKEQREIFDDPNRYLFAICSRRVGKSTLASRLLVADSLEPNHRGLYIGPKATHAKGIGLKMVVDLLEQMNYVRLKGSQTFSANPATIEYRVHTDPGGALVEFNNGSTITFRGNSKTGEADNYQGFKYTFCVVDEVQSQCCLDYLLNQILSAAMVDVKGSKQLLIGTPPRVPNTYCEKLWNMKDNVYSKFHWDMSKNPYLENDVETEIEIACKKAGVNKDSTFIQREYYGKFVYDTEALIFKDYKLYDKIPEDFIPTKVWVGVDWGYVDSNAITVTAVDYYNKKAYVIYDRSFKRADTDEQEIEVQKAYYFGLDFLKKYRIPNAEHNICIVCDTNQPSLTLKIRRAGLPIVEAYKPVIVPTIEALATDMRTKLYIPRGSVLEEECTKTLWERDDSGRILPKVDDVAFHPNAIHALRYTHIMWTDDWQNYNASNAEYIDPADGPEDYDQQPNYEVIGVEEEWH
jgi:hypothetical protein